MDLTSLLISVVAPFKIMFHNLTTEHHRQRTVSNAGSIKAG